MNKRGATRAIILKALEDHGPASVQGLVKRTGLSLCSVAGAVCTMRDNTDLLRVVGWERRHGTSGRIAAVWGLGPGEDVPKIAPEPKAKCQERYRKKHRRAINKRAASRRFEEQERKEALRKVDANVARVREKAKAGELNHWMQLLGV